MHKIILGTTSRKSPLPLLYDRNLDPPFNSQQNTSFNNFRIKIITNKSQSFFEIRKNLIEKNTFDRRIAHPRTHAKRLLHRNHPPHLFVSCY